MRDAAVHPKRIWWKRPGAIIGGVLIVLVAGPLAAASFTNWTQCAANSAAASPPRMPPSSAASPGK